MGDRACIASNGKFKKHLSDIDILTCCNDCGYGKTAQKFSNDEKAIMREIMTNGPVVAPMRLHADFAFYEKKITLCLCIAEWAGDDE
ncbi:hypothetical protein ANCCAN_08063, partial [Ancylostoma caninum]